MQWNYLKHTGIHVKEKKRRDSGKGEGASVVQVVVAVHHQCLEEEEKKEHSVTERQRGVNSWHAAAASQCQQKDTCLPTSKNGAKERHHQRRARGLWEMRILA